MKNYLRTQITLYEEDKNYPIWRRQERRSKYAVQLASWQLRSNSPKMSVRPERFPGICLRMHGGISLKLHMLMYLDHLQNWLVYGHGLVIFLILDLVKRVKFGVSGYFLENAWRKWPEILHADESWQPSELISLWSRSGDFSNFGAFWT